MLHLRILFVYPESTNVLFKNTEEVFLMKDLFLKWQKISLVTRIGLGIIIGVLLALTLPDTFSFVSIFGTIFVSALKAIAPVLVLILVIQAISSHTSTNETNMKLILMLYAIGTLSAGAVGVIISFLFPVNLTLSGVGADASSPEGILEVLQTLLLNLFNNPVTALMNANYLSILFWAVVFGIALKGAASSTKLIISNFGDAIIMVVKWIIELAPIGIIGLVFDAIATSGLSILSEYAHLLLVLLGSMVVVALVVNPLIVYLVTKKNPYPLVFLVLRESGITAFFTRSSAANIPVNLNLSKKLGLNKETYSVSIPLGATINMAGASITISVLALAATHTLGIQVDIFTAILLVFISAISAAGASGVPGGSLLLIPLACGFFGISQDISMQIVAIGFIIAILQDSCETALNSSTDVLFTAAADQAAKAKEKKLAI